VSRDHPLAAMRFLDTDPASWEWCLRFNLTSAFLLTRNCIPHLLEGDGRERRRQSAVGQLAPRPRPTGLSG